MTDATYGPSFNSPGEPFRCPRCAVVHGWVMTREGATRLHVGRQTIRSYVGECECGEVLHWTASARKLNALLRRLENAHPD